MELHFIAGCVLTVHIAIHFCKDQFSPFLLTMNPEYLTSLPQAVPTMPGAIDLPVDVVAKVAGGSLALRPMRGASKTWKAGYDLTITKIKISFDGPPLPADGSLSQRFPELTSLEVGDCPMDESRLVNLRGLKQLKVLVLGEPDFTWKDYNLPPGSAFAEMAKVLNDRREQRRNERGLLVHGLTSAGMQHLRGLPLTKLLLRKCKLLKDAGLEPLRGMPLERLDLEGCGKISDSGLENLRGMPLTDLNLNGCGEVSDEGLKCLAGMPLKRLNLSGCKITDVGVRYLRGMPIEVLDLSYCVGVTDESVEPLLAMSGLKELDISRCAISGPNFYEKLMEGIRIVRDD